MLRIDRRIQDIRQRLRGYARRISQMSADKKHLAKELQQERERRRLAERRLKQTRKRLREQLSRMRQQSRQTAREYVLCRMPKQSVCAEIGVYEGAFSKQILDNVEPRKLHLIDPWRHERTAWPRNLEEDRYQDPQLSSLGCDGRIAMDERYRTVKQRFAEELRTGQVQIHRNLSSVVSDDFEDSYFDWIYIDGNHFYEFVKQDLELYYPKVKTGGYITGDDYGVRNPFENGVQRAVDEFVSRRPDLMLEAKFTQFIIKKG